MHMSVSPCLSSLLLSSILLIEGHPFPPHTGSVQDKSQHKDNGCHQYHVSVSLRPQSMVLLLSLSLSPTYPHLPPPPPLTHHLLVHSLIYPLTHYVSYFCRYHRDQTAPQVLIDPLTNLPTIHFAPSPTSLRYIPSCPLPDTIVTKLPPPLFIALHRWEMYEKRVPLTIDFQGVYPSPSFPLSKLFRRYRHCHYLCRRSLISFPLFLLL